MKYRNVKTGVVIEVNSRMRGDWLPVEEKTEKKAAPAAKRKRTVKK